MSRAQTGITPLPPKNILTLSFKVRDIPLSAMSVGHITANIPGLANEVLKSFPGSDLRYILGFGWQLWNFIWQGSVPPGFSHLEVEEVENDLEEDDVDDEEDSGPTLLFGFSASETDILHEMAHQSQTHLKNIAEVHETLLGTPIENPEGAPAEMEKQASGAWIGNQHPEYAQSSYLLALSMAHANEKSQKGQAFDQENLGKSLHQDFKRLTEKEPGMFHHLNTLKQESGHYLLAFCDRTAPFQDIIDRLTNHTVDSSQVPLQAPWTNLRISPSLYFLPSLEILAGLRMGTLRMGPLSPTARWK